MNRDEFKGVARIGVISISRMLGLFMVLPVLSLWARDLPNATPLLVGLAVGGYGVSQALLQIPYGALSDRIGRVPVLLLGLAIFIAGSVLAASAETIQGVIAGRVLQGAGAISATLSAWLADITREQVRTQAMALFGVGIGASFLLALILGPALSSQIGVRGLFWVSAGLGVVGVLLVLPKMHVPTASESRSSSAWRWAELLSGRLLALDAGVLALHAALTALFVMAPFLLLDRATLAAESHWKIYSLALLAAIPVVVPMIMGDGRQRKPRFAPLAMLLLTAGFALIWFAADSLWLFGLGTSAFFAGFSYLEASLPATLSRLAAADQRGATMGIFSSAQFLGAFVGGAGAGLFLGYYSAEQGMLLLAVASAMATVVIGIKSHKESEF